jgi:hypothetical protein
MNPNSSHLTFVLDRSGSMEAMTGDAIEGFNALLREQQAIPGHATLTLLLFDDRFESPADFLPIAEVVPLDCETYVPRASTALLDAIGHAIDTTGSRLAAMPESDRPGTVIVAILTDGHENASQRFTWHDIAAKIRHQEEHYSWKFLFLGANQDAIATAAQIGLSADQAATYDASGKGLHASYKTSGRKISAFRRKAAGDQSAEVLRDAEASTRTLYDEEFEKDNRPEG